MKKFLSAVLVCVMLLGCVLTLASCGNKPSGKYQARHSEDPIIYIETYNFKINKVIKTVETGAVGYTKTEETEYKYKVNKKDDGTLTLELTEIDNEDAKTISYSYEKGKKYIKINGVQYDKIK